MNLCQIEVFCVVMWVGILFGVVDVLYVLQLVVSCLICYLEVKLQVVLFECSGGCLYVMFEVMVLMCEIDSVWCSIDCVKMVVEQLCYGVFDMLCICINFSLVLDLVLCVVVEFKCCMLGLYIVMEIVIQIQIIEQLLIGECDIGVVVFVQYQYLVLMYYLIGEGNVLCVMVVDYLLVMWVCLKLEDIYVYDVIFFGIEIVYGKVVEGLLGSCEGVCKVMVDVCYVYIVCSVVVYGWGIVLVDDLMVVGFKDVWLVVVLLVCLVCYSVYVMVSVECLFLVGGCEMVSLLQVYWKEVC